MVAKIVAEFWSQFLADDEVSFNNGDDSEMGNIASMLANISHKSYDKETVEKFKNKLESLINDRFKGKKHFFIENDYDPDPILVEAFEFATGEEPTVSTFPWKTAVVITNGEVKAKIGYGCEYRTLYKEK